uniref:Transmembrane protein 161B n=1 Tax=Panagrellus redivivus TaxID=6233 RepID=A0A7E4W074_PANRE
MAVLGFHLVVTLIALTIFSKIKVRYSFCHLFVLRGLYYFMPPTLGELRQAVDHKFNEKRRKKNVNPTEPFNVPKDTPIRLLKLPLSAIHLDGVPFFDTLTFVVDYLVFALIVFSISETFVYFFPENRDTNVSIVWLLIAAAFMLQALAKLTASNIGSPELTEERNLILSFFAVTFLFCVIFTMSCDKYMDVHFTEGYKNFTKIVGTFLKEQRLYNVASYETKSPILLYVVLSTMCSSVAAMLLFPIIRYTTMYGKAVKEVGKFLQLALHLTFLLPVVALVLYTNAVRDHLLLSGRYPYLNETRLDALRLAIILIWVLARFLTAKYHLQSFLNTAEEKIIELQKETGHIKSDKLQRLVIQYAQYFCAAALQYFVPVLLTLTVALLLKNLGDIDFIRQEKPDTPELTLEDVEDPNSLASLKILLNFRSQKAFWTYSLINLLIVNTSLSVFGRIFSYNFSNSV